MPIKVDLNYILKLQDKTPHTVAGARSISIK